MITPENLVRHELIGLEAKIVNSTNKNSVGIRGRVVDETRNILTIEKKNGREASFVKEQCVFSFKIPSGQWVRVDGKIIVARPEDRVKKKFKAW